MLSGKLTLHCIQVTGTLLVHAHLPPLSGFLELCGNSSESMEQITGQHMAVADMEYELGIIYLFNIVDLVVIARLALSKTHTVPRRPVIAFIPARQPVKNHQASLHLCIN